MYQYFATREAVKLVWLAAGFIAAAVFLLPLTATGGDLPAPPAQTGVSAGAVLFPPAAAEPTEPPDISGSWTGAKLLCRKEEGRAVRCGKPGPFDVVFNADGTGTSSSEDFPSPFTYTWLSPGKVKITPTGEGQELELFQITYEDGLLTFQAYIYLPVDDPDLPAEERYIHYIFDLYQGG